MKENKNIRYYRQNNLSNAKELRKQATREENRLWYDFLRHHPSRFRRQVPVGPYIADFLSVKAKLIIELDGEQHYTEEGERKDKIRTEYLNRLGYRVQRFDNWDITRAFDEVCRDIDEMANDPDLEPKVIRTFWGIKR